MKTFGHVCRHLIYSTRHRHLTLRMCSRIQVRRVPSSLPCLLAPLPVPCSSVTWQTGSAAKKPLSFPELCGSSAPHCNVPPPYVPRVPFSGFILSRRTGSRNADCWPHCLRYLCWDRINHHSTLSGGNHFTLNSRSPRLCSTMVYYMGNSYPIFYPVWLLLHRGWSVFPDSMGSPGNSGHHTFCWHAVLPRISSMAF